MLSLYKSIRLYKIPECSEVLHICERMCAQSYLTLCDPMDCSPPENSPGKNTGVGCHFQLQGIFPTQRLNPHLFCLMHWQGDSLPLHHLGRPFSMGTAVTQWCLILCNLMDCSPLGSGAGPILTTHSISELCVLLFFAFSLHV